MPELKTKNGMLPYSNGILYFTDYTKTDGWKQHKMIHLIYSF